MIRILTCFVIIGSTVLLAAGDVVILKRTLKDGEKFVHWVHYEKALLLSFDQKELLNDGGSKRMPLLADKAYDIARKELESRRGKGKADIVNIELQLNSISKRLNNVPKNEHRFMWYYVIRSKNKNDRIFILMDGTLANMTLDDDMKKKLDK